MANTATIRLELSVNDVVQLTDFTSETVELAGFQWFVTGKYYDHRSVYWICETEIHCAPIGEKKNCIWNCEAFGKFIAFTTDSDVRCAKLWARSYDFFHPTTEPVSVEFYKRFPEGTNIVFEKANKKFFKMDVQINVVSFKLVDLSDPNNQMIQSSEDAAQVDVEGEKLWLSKTLLGCHSPFFKVLFNGDFKEKLTGQYELKEIKLNEFLHCLYLLYAVHVETDANAIEYLVKLGDYFQCDAIICHCRQLLLHSAIPIGKKLKLIDQLGLHYMAEKLLLKMDYASLAKIVDSGDVLEFSGVMNCLIMTRMHELPVNRVVVHFLVVFTFCLCLIDVRLLNNTSS